MNAQHNPFDVLDELDLDNGNDGIAAPSYHTGKVEGRKKQKKRAHEAKKQAAAHEENLFVGVEELFGLGALEGGDDGGSKDKTKREKKRDRRRAKEMVKARGGLVLGDAGESFVVDEGGEGVGAEGAGLELEEDVVAVAGGIGGEGGGPGRALVRDLEGKGKRKEGKKEKRREKAARDSKNRYLDSLDPGMGMLEWEDGLRAAKKAGRVADQWAVVDAIEGDAFERDADKVYEFRVTKGKGVSVFALEDIEQGTMIMSEDPLLETPKNASLEAVARGFMRLSPGDQAIFLELSDGVSPGQQLAWKNKIDEAVRTVGAQDWGWGLDDSELFKILAIRQINGLKVGRGGDAVFLSISRINHSCLPNAHVFWNERLRRMVVHVTLDIVAGEEITANYLSDVEALLNREARRQKLENWWYFRCECVACDISAPFSVASERRRVEAAGLTEDFQNMQEQLEEVLLGDTEHNKEILEQKRRDLLTVVREQASVLEEEGLLGIELVRMSVVPVSFMNLHFDLTELTMIHAVTARPQR